MSREKKVRKGRKKVRRYLVNYHAECESSEYDNTTFINVRKMSINSESMVRSVEAKIKHDYKENGLKVLDVRIDNFKEL
jgi:hypothetical protein